MDGYIVVAAHTVIVKEVPVPGKTHTHYCSTFLLFHVFFIPLLSLLLSYSYYFFLFISLFVLIPLHLHFLLFPSTLIVFFTNSFHQFLLPIPFCLLLALRKSIVHHCTLLPILTIFLMSLSSCICMCVDVGAVVAEEEAQTGARANVLAAAWAAAEVPKLPHRTDIYVTLIRTHSLPLCPSMCFA